jgi:hypothetical protein
MLCLLELFMSQPREFGEPALDALFELQENTKDAIVAVIRQEGIPGLAEALEGVLEGTIPVIKVEKTDDD